MSLKCVIKRCNSKVNRNSPYHSYCLPKQEKSPDRHASWLKHAEKTSYSKNPKVCAIHFEPTDFDESDMLKIRLLPDIYKNRIPKLKKGVVPTLHLGDEYKEEECKKGGTLPTPYLHIKDVQDILNGEDSQPSTSVLDPTCESSSDEGEEQQKEIAIQCEFGAEVYRGFKAGGTVVDK